MVTRKKIKNGKTYEYNSVEINGIQGSLVKELENIAYNLGIASFSEFMRPKLREIRDSYPENMRQDPKAI